jgi:acyl carrier protein
MPPSATSKSSLDRVRVVAAAVFDLPVDSLRAESSPETVEAWDSLGHLNLMLAVEEETGIRLSPEETMDIASLADLVALLNKKGLGASE